MSATPIVRVVLVGAVRLLGLGCAAVLGIQLDLWMVVDPHITVASGGITDYLPITLPFASGLELLLLALAAALALPSYRAPRRWVMATAMIVSILGFADALWRMTHLRGDSDGSPWRWPDIPLLPKL